MSTEDEAQKKIWGRALRVLRIVHELHKRGYQLLRICPGMNSSGTAWRVGITPVTNICRDNGAYWADWDKPELVAIYSSGQEKHYFDWTDATEDKVPMLAAKFRERYPRLVAKSEGRDWEYVGWYVEMLGLAEREDFPVAYADFMGHLRPGYLPTLQHMYDSRLPLPPAGKSERLSEQEYCR